MGETMIASVEPRSRVFSSRPARSTSSSNATDSGGRRHRSRIRTRLPAGGRWIRTIGPRRERAGFCCGRRIAGPNGSQKRLFLMRYRWFESISLQRRVCLSPGAAFECREPRLSARLCAAGLATGSAETRRVLQDRANRRQYLCRAIFQYRSAADGVGVNATPLIKSGVRRA